MSGGLTMIFIILIESIIPILIIRAIIKAVKRHRQEKEMMLYLKQREVYLLEEQNRLLYNKNNDTTS